MEYRLKEILQDKGYIRGPFGSSLKRNELKSTGIQYMNNNMQYMLLESLDIT